MTVNYCSEKALEAIARKVLCDYDRNYLNATPQAVPIEKIIENNFGLSIEYLHITNNGRILGKTIFDDGITTFYNTEKHKYDFIEICAGTILIDASLLDAKLIGRLRFTYAHELAHWIKHKNIYSGTNEVAALTKNETNNNIEWQANVIATNILMPAGQVKRCFYEISRTHTMNEVISTMADVFKVSRQVMKIRLQTLCLEK